MSAVVHWIENARFFGRPIELDRRAGNVSCSAASSLPAFDSAFSSCRVVAAGDCSTADVQRTWSGDACVCATLSAYNAAFSACIHDTPYSDCIDPNNDKSLTSWSSEHCSSSKTPSPSVSITPSKITTPSSTTPRTPSSSSETTPSSSKSSESSSTTSSSKESSTSTPSSSTSSSSTEPSSSTTSTTGTSTSSKTPMSTPSTVPTVSLVPVTVASHTPAATTMSTSTTSTHSPLPKYSGTGNLLQGYCITPEYTLLGGPTAYWAPVIGCIGDKTDCCPFDVPATTSAAKASGSVPSTVTVALPTSGGSATTIASADNGGFPSAAAPAQATLQKCPDDYFSISGGCCPSNYFPWSTAFGGQTPCYSTIPTAMTPPPIPDSLVGSDPSKPTSAIVNVVYAMQYPVKDAPKPPLATSAKIGIGAGAGGAALVFGILIWLLIWKHRAHKKDKEALKSLSGVGSTRQSVAASSAVGGVQEWRQNVVTTPNGSRFYEGLETNPQPRPTLPNVGVQRYPADWRPGQRTISPPLPGSFVHNPVPLPVPSPPVPEGYSEADSQTVILNQQQQRYSNNTTPNMGSDGGFSSGNRSELQSGEYPFPRQELQGVPEEQQWVQGNGHVYQDGVGEPWQPERGASPNGQVYQGATGQSWQPQQRGQGPTRYYEAPAGRM